VSSLCALALASPLSGQVQERGAAGVQVSQASCSRAVSWDRARSVVGRTAAIKGRVASTHYAVASNGSPTFLNLGRPYPDPRRFQVVIWREDRSKFGSAPERRYRGRLVCVTGYVELYQGVPEIEADAGRQIRILG
jgi:hypothetical protein